MSELCLSPLLFLQIKVSVEPLVVGLEFNSMFARLGTDYEIRNQWFFAILEVMSTD